MGLFKELILTAFVIITIIGWLVQFINSQNHPPPPARRRRDNNEQGGGKVRNEIEQFLDEARRSRQGQPPQETMAGGVEVVEQPRRAPAEQQAREEVWREQTRGRRQPAQQQVPRPQQQQQQQQRKQPKKQPRQTAAQPTKTLAAKPAVSKLAVPLRASTQTDVARHVQEQMGERIGKGVAAHLPNSVGSNVEAHLGRFTADADDSLGSQGLRETMSRRSGQGSDLRQLLRSKQGIRSAILINEILGPPLSRRPRS